MKKLFTPVLFLSVEFPEKWKFIGIVPVFFTVCYILIFALSGRILDIYNPTLSSWSIVSNLIEFVALLAAFFLAALAAVSTFNHPNLDKAMHGEGAKLFHAHFKEEPEILTRRRFLSFLFGYLSFSCFIFFIFELILPALESILKSFYVTIYGFDFYIFHMVSFLMLLYFFHIVCISLVGLHYLSERMTRPPKPKI